MPGLYSESDLEDIVLQWFEELGFAYRPGPELAPQAPGAERRGFDEAFLPNRLRAALECLNPGLPPEALAEAYRRITTPESPNLLESNHTFHRLLTDGVDVPLRLDKGEQTYAKARLLDFANPGKNDWLVVNQFTMIEAHHHRRPDVVVFVNGLPLGVMELKSPFSAKATTSNALKQLRTYQYEIPSLFLHNEVLVGSDGLVARAGCLGASSEGFLPWRTVDGTVVSPTQEDLLETLIKGLFDPHRFLDLVRHFLVFESDGAQVKKKMARYHQYHAVKEALRRTLAAVASEEDRKIGVVWHTQGSGKSLTMAFYAGKVIQEPAMANPTIVVLTDRNDLDDQLFGTFSRCRELLRQTPVQAQSREHLQEVLKVPSGGVVFTTLQKFLPEGKKGEFPCLSERQNIVVIADEAHRSQYSVHGLAHHLRTALPKASFIAFTATPVELVGRDTYRVFGECLHSYTVHQAVEDGATVPIYYESRLIPLELQEKEKGLVDQEFDEVTEDREDSEKSQLKRRWSRLEAVVGAEKRVKQLAKDVVEHFEQRLEVLKGKGMVVCMSRRICVELYKEIIALRPEWHSDREEEGVVKVVMTGSATDPVEWQPHLHSKAQREALAARFKNPEDPFRLVIVRDMWLTGFDAPCLHTLYCDKPMQGHGLMQTIARVNRVFHDKPAGLVVDYLGLAEKLKQALHYYSAEDQETTKLDVAQAVAKMQEELEVLRGMFHGFDYSSALSEGLPGLMPILYAAMEHVLSLARSDGEEEPRKRYLEHVTALSRAFALSIPDPAALAVKEEVRFFQQIRAALVKVTGDGEQASGEEVEAAIRQIISRAVDTGAVVDLFAEAGLKKPDIAVLSDTFLAEVRGMKHKNLAVEALRRLLEDGIKLRQRQNPLEAGRFSQLLKAALDRYKSRTIEASAVIEELLQIARDLQAAAKRGEELGLTDDELAFYDALAQNESAKEVMGDESLRVIARELLRVVRKNATIDWSVRQSTRAKLRVIVKRILRKYGYPPDLQKAATDTVLEQAEELCEVWVEE